MDISEKGYILGVSGIPSTYFYFETNMILIYLDC